MQRQKPTSGLPPARLRRAILQMTLPGRRLTVFLAPRSRRGELPKDERTAR